MRRSALSLLVLLAWAPARADDAAARARKYYYEDIAEPFFAPDPARPGWIHAVRPGAKPSSFPAKKAAGTFRVFVIGGSIASLLTSRDEPAVDFGAQLGGLLPGRAVEVVNCGMAGYDSYREALVEQEILEYEPDLIVMMTGHNEGIASAPIPVWVMHAQERLSRFAAYRSLVKTLHPDLGDEQKRTAAAADARDAAFERNLTQNLAHARERGVEVALVVPPRNWREPPEHLPTLYDASFLPGWLRFLRGDYAGARRVWRAALKKGLGDPDREAFAWSFVARAEEKLGLWDEARASFERGARLDRAPICGPRCQDVIRRAAAREGAFLVEADAAFRERTAPRLPGLETFNDRMHWKPRFTCVMTSRIAAAARARPAFASLGWDDARARALDAGCPGPGTADEDGDVTRTLSYALMDLSWPKRPRLSAIDVLYLDRVGKARPAWLDDVPALMKRSTNPQTQVYGITMVPESVVLPRFHWHVAEVRLLSGDFHRARAQATRALELDPSLHWARLTLAVATAFDGEKARAASVLKEAAAASAGDADQHADLFAAARAIASELALPSAGLAEGDAASLLAKAEKALAAGDRKGAVAAADRARALSLQPQDFREAAQIYARARSYEKFLGLWERLLALYPRDVDIWLLRTEALILTGRPQQGARALARAEALATEPRQSAEIARYRGWLRDGPPADLAAPSSR